jgi:hypothetical protein
MQRVRSAVRPRERSGQFVPRRLLAAALFLLIPALAHPFGPATNKRLADVTLRLAPPALRALLVARRAHLDRGVADGLAKGEASDAAALAAEAQREYDLLPALPGIGAPLDEVAYHFGRIAGLVFCANDPLRYGTDPRGREVRTDYLRYVERKLPLMVFAFDGYGSPALDRDLQGYLRRRMGKSGRYQKAILYCYFPEGGGRVKSDGFDDRSNAFGVAQVWLSHAVSDAAKVWLNAWKAMDGDVSATPYYTGGAAR